MFITRLKSARNLSTITTKHRRVPSKYRSLAIQKAQQAITDYLSTTRSLSYTHAEHIATNAAVSINKLILKLDFSVPTFSKSLRKYLSYHPINEFEFFFESIGINYSEVNYYLPDKKFFFSEDRSVLDAAVALCKFGFPWNKLGMLYKEERLVFELTSEEIESRLVKLKSVGFSTLAVVGICLAIPRTLCGSGEIGAEVRCLFVKLKRVFEEFGVESRFEEDVVDCWYVVSRKVKVFYDLGCGCEEMWELMGRRKSVFDEYSEEVLLSKAEFFGRFGVRKEDCALLILRNPVVLDYDLEEAGISVTGMLKHFGLSQDEVDVVGKKYPYVFGRNKMKNLPHVVRALDLHERVFDRLMNGEHHLLDSYSLIDPDEDIDTEYQQGVEEIQHSKTKIHNIQKLDFLHEIGYGENALTMKILQHVHGTALELHDRFQILLNNGIEFSKICMMIKSAPKILNQKPHSIQDKLRFLCREMGGSLEYLAIFPAFLCFDLENRIDPRFRFHKWLTENELTEISYSVSSIVATSEKAFIARLHRIHPAIPKHWFERFSISKTKHTTS